MNDIEEPVPLESLDPGTQSPGFWVRFHARALDQAQMELARRRVNGDLTFAAPLAPLALEEALLEGLEGETIPVILGQERELEELAFFSSLGGF